MSKMSDLNAALNELRRNAKSVLEIADAIEKEFITKKDEAPKAGPKTKPLFEVPTQSEETPAEPAPEISLSDIKAVLMEKSKAGFDAEVHTLIKSYNAPKLSAIDPSHYAELMEKAKVIGNA